MMYKLNQEAFQYIEMLIKKPNEPGIKFNSKPVDIKGIPEIIDLGTVEIDSVGSNHPFTGELQTRYRNIRGNMIGLDEEGFFRFKVFMKKIYELPLISNSCTFEKLLEIAFDWLIEVYTQQRSSLQITDYIEKNIEALTETYIFRFRIVSIGIENSFVIGNTEFKYFDEMDIKAHYKEIVKENPETTYENFKMMVGKQYESINAIVQIRGEFSKATEKAFAEAQLSVDVLKCFCFPNLMAKTTRSFDLDYRYRGHTSADYMYLINGDLLKCRLNTKAMEGVAPIEITKLFLEEVNRIGMDVFSCFLRERKDRELDLKIIDMIKLFAQAASSYDHYEKVKICISLFESMAIPEGNPKAKGYTLFKKIAGKLIPEHQLETLQGIGLIMYKVRDKLMHNNNRWPFETTDLFTFMDFMRIFILHTIDISKKNGGMQDFYNYHGIIMT